MILIDVNVLLYAFRADAERHKYFRQWLLDTISAVEPFGMSDQVLSVVIRIATHPRIFVHPSRLAEATAFTNAVREQTNCVRVQPGERHWEIFNALCRKADARGNLITDAWFAALAIEHNCEWITTDRDYARFPDLKWRHPLKD
jgi:toxin-antitoxin system PIN domain toxin